MSNLIKGYYHCNECDSLFESQVIGANLQDCPHCGKAVAGIAEIGPELGIEDDFFLDDEDSLDQNHDRDGGVVSVDKDNDKQPDVDVEQTTEKKKIARQLRLISIYIYIYIYIIVYFSHICPIFFLYFSIVLTPIGWASFS